MTHLIDYRGPDGYGFALAPGVASLAMTAFHNTEPYPLPFQPAVGLGNRRLAILDVSTAGSQPMQTEDRSCTITFNGEIYNYKEIRRELEQDGARFRSNTDTEVILRAYQHWGEACLQHFNGMWAFAIWDSARELLFCARDRFGVKPFYYAVHDGRFVFASEIKQILHATKIPRTAKPDTVCHFLEWGLMDYSSDTFFEGIHQLKGGHCLKLELKSPHTPEVRRYWELQTEPQLNLSDADALAEFRALFESAVNLRLRSDVPVGVSLSGGLDSSAVACKARQLEGTAQLQTFSSCFEDPEIDEREYVSAVVREIDGIGHMAFPQGAEFWRKLRTLIYHQDEPAGSPGIYPQWCVMADARTHGVPVILGGQGGDEALCGYQKYQFFHWCHLIRRGDAAFLRELGTWLTGGTSSHWTWPTLARYLPRFFGKHFSVTNRIGTTEMKQLSRVVTTNLGSGSTLAERQKTDLVYSSIPALLHHEDRASMAHSVESRLPFLDYRLVEFSLRCPSSLKLRNGWSKWLLRNALVGTLPEKVRLRRTKLGFHTPEKRWMRLGLQNGYRCIWDTDALRMGRFIDPQKLRKECLALLSDSRRALGPGMLFRAISLETWADVYSVN